MPTTFQHKMKPVVVIVNKGCELIFGSLMDGPVFLLVLHVVYDALKLLVCIVVKYSVFQVSVLVL